MLSAVVPLPDRALRSAEPAGDPAQRPRLRTPWYARDAVSAAAEPQLHEYRGAQFMQRFDADLAGQRLTASTAASWFRVNALDGDGHPRLRQPIHDGFTLVCCELACGDRAGAPLDPARVADAWLATLPTAGQGLGATTDAAAGRWPLRPRLARDAGGRSHTLLVGLLPVAELAGLATGTAAALPAPDGPAPDGPAPNGRALASATPDWMSTSADALAARFGSPPPSPGRDQLLWRPERGEEGLDDRLGALVQLVEENLGLGSRDGRLVYAAEAVDGSGPEIEEWRAWLGDVYFYAEPDPAPYQRLRQAQRDYRQLLAAARSAVVAFSPPAGTGAGLREELEGLGAVLDALALPPRLPGRLRFLAIADYAPSRIAAITAPAHAQGNALDQPLGAVLGAAPMGGPLAPGFATLVQALSRLRDALTELAGAALALEAQFPSTTSHRGPSLLQWLLTPPDPDNPDPPLPERLPDDLKLIAPAGWMAAGPDLIRDRWLALARGVLTRLPADAEAGTGVGAGTGAGAGAGAEPGRALDRVERAADRLHRVAVHVRIRGEHGCEYQVQSDPSPAFRIASVHDTRLMPNRPIPMPTLADLKRAIAGPAMVLPSDTADSVARVRFDDGEVKEVEADGGGIRWIYVFSLPIVTLCAMILLMLMITLLNFIFRWLPFAILRLPFPR